MYLVSSGVNPAVKFFEMLQIPPENVFAVDLRFDQQEIFWILNAHHRLSTMMAREPFFNNSNSHAKILFTLVMA